MSIYDNESKIYPGLNPTAPQEPQAYRLKKITEIEAYLLDEIEERRRRAKKKKRFNKTIGIVDVGLTTSSAIAGGTSIPAFFQRRWPTCWRCLRRDWGSSFPFNDCHIKIFQVLNGEARKTQCY